MDTESCFFHKCQRLQHTKDKQKQFHSTTMIKVEHCVGAFIFMLKKSLFLHVKKRREESYQGLQHIMHKTVVIFGKGLM